MHSSSCSVRSSIVLGVLAVAFGAVIACSSDDTATPTTALDAGKTTTPDGSTPGACPSVQAAACGNTSCTAQLGAPATCVNNACVKLAGPNCETYGELADDNAVLLGVILPRTGVNAPYNGPIAAGAKLAVDEINAAGGIPTNVTDQCAPRRKLGLVWCDDDITDGANPTAPNADFLTKTLKLPLVIGSYASGHTMPLAKNFVLPAKAMMISPGSTSPQITHPETNTDPLITFDATDGAGTRLLWRTAVSDAAQSVACQALYQQIEPTTAPKVALLNKLDPYGQGMIPGFEAKLKVGGATPVPYYINDKLPPGTATGQIDNTANITAGGNFFRRDFRVDLGVSPSDTSTDLANLVSGLYAFGPKVIVPIGTNESLNLIDAYEAKLTTQNVPEANKPTWILVDGQRASALFDVITKHTTLKDRIRGIVAGVPSQLESDLEVRFKAKFADQDPRAYGVTQAYDATYSLAYSIASLKGGAVTGVAVAKGMTNLLSGTKVDLGPANISAAFEALVSGSPVNINGTSGPLDYNTTTGEAIADYSVWCVKSVQAGGYAFNDTTGEIYSSVDGVLKGTFSCQ